MHYSNIKTPCNLCKPWNAKLKIGVAFGQAVTTVSLGYAQSQFEFLWTTFLVCCKNN